jgi:hypothetical protein
VKLVLTGTLKCDEYTCESTVPVPVKMVMSTRNEGFTIVLEPYETPEGWQHIDACWGEPDEYYCPEHVKKEVK